MRTILTAAFAIIFCLTSAAFGAAAAGTKVCPNCGEAMPANFNFCGNCGTNIENVAPLGTIVETTTTTSTGRTTTTTTTAAPKQNWFRDAFFGPSSQHGSALSDQPLPLRLEGFPDRPKPLIEIGQSPFLGVGPIAPGFKIPTGAVWQPDFIIFGTARVALQTFDNGRGQISELVGRLDLFGNLFLTPTERILIGFRPLDRDGLDYTGYRFDPDKKIHRELNAYVTTLFFQGDFGELFPNLDPNDVKGLDIQFAIGRQPLSFQDGIMINEDEIDAFGLTKTSAFFLGASSWRATGIFAFNELNRNNNVRESSAKLFGLFNTADYAKFTLDLDFAYVNAEADTGGDGAYLGIGVTQRFGLFNSTTRINGSLALDRETPAVSSGVLLFQQISTTLPNKDIAYFDGFWGIADYSSAARGEDRGGPLGQTGILFAAQGLGGYGAPLGNRANDAVGLALGYQHFLGTTDKQLTFEVGGRVATDDPRFFAASQPDSVAAAGRYQMKLNQHSVLIFDAFVGFPEERATAYGFRSELLLKF
ncbi:MAG: zinc ribbon domain-containing protein [Verrucomicrobiota bacterium]|nr:zinc ribbon domain-containing protein [Verrucomicrobiota bacterium]